MNVLYALRRAKQFYGAAPAYHHGDRSVTYAEFVDRVARLAAVFADLGIQPGDRVAVLMLNAPRYLELFHALPLAGAVIVPLNIRWTVAEIAFGLSDSGSRLLVVDDAFARLQPRLSASLPDLRFLFAGNEACPAGMADYEASLAAAAPAGTEAPDPAPDDLVALFYTSGTTGGTKGVMLTHRNLWANALHCTIIMAISPDWVFLHAAPMFHLADAAIVYAIVMQGGANCFLPAFDLDPCLRLIEQCRITHSVLLPTMLNRLVNHPAINRYDHSSLRVILYGGSPLPLEVLRRAREKLRCQYAQAYGLTEASPVLTYLCPRDHELECRPGACARVQSAGRPILGVEVKIVDPVDRELPAGEAGEIVARGANVMKGYWNQPLITAETLRGGWLHTGDIGAFDADGYLHLLDRKKDMIKSGGENIYSPQVEAAVAAHPEVLEVAVIGVPDTTWGEAVKAVVVKRQGSTLTEAGLIEFCRERMAHFQCPTSVEFLDTLPKGGTGKVEKSLLRKMHQPGTSAAAP
jgi:long-chain acyl-CoA synthetase